MYIGDTCSDSDSQELAGCIGGARYRRAIEFALDLVGNVSWTGLHMRFSSVVVIFIPT